MEMKEIFELYVDEDLEDLIPMFIRTRLKDVEELKSALINKDTDKIKFIGHALKGVGSGYGFDEVTSLGKEIELLAKEDDLSKISELITQLEYYLNHVHINFIEE